MSFKRLALISLLLACGPAGAASTTDWAWLAGTTWYVPEKGLPAYQYNVRTNTIKRVTDQTVYRIAAYRNGYFYGNVVAVLSDGSASCQSLVGSVTPEGRLYLTFNVQPYTAGAEPTIGFGDMVSKAGAWSMVNQMSTGSGPVQVGHWANMQQTAPGMPGWDSLPGSGLSVEKFLAQCPDNTPVAD